MLNRVSELPEGTDTVYTLYKLKKFYQAGNTDLGESVWYWDWAGTECGVWGPYSKPNYEELFRCGATGRDHYEFVAFKMPVQEATCVPITTDITVNIGVHLASPGTGIWRYEFRKLEEGDLALVTPIDYSRYQRLRVFAPNADDNDNGVLAGWGYVSSDCSYVFHLVAVPLDDDARNTVELYK